MAGIEGNLIDADRNGTSLGVDLEPGSALGSAGVEVFILAGQVVVGGERLGPLDYALLSAPAEVVGRGFAIAWVPIGEPVAAARVQLASAAEWRTPALGSANGMFFRPLRTEEHVGEVDGRRVTGTTRGFRRLTALAPGWRELRCELHPGCREENILLAGDLLVCGEGRGAMHPGSVLVNEIGLRHGPMATRSGAVLLISCDSWMAVDWSDAGRDDLELVNRYLSEGFEWPGKHEATSAP